MSTEPPTKTESIKKPEKAKAPRSRLFSVVLLFLFMILLLPAYAGLAYLYLVQMPNFVTRSEQQATNQQNKNNLQSEINIIKQAQRQLSAQNFGQNLLQHGDKINAMTVRIATLEKTQSQQLQTNPETNQRWHLLEAEYLLHTAVQHLTLTKNIASALEFMAKVDQLLASITDPDILKIRSVLANETASLEAIVEPDIGKTFINLAVLIKKIENVPTVSQAEQNISEQSTDQNLWAQIQHKFTNLVSFRQIENSELFRQGALTSWHMRVNLKLILEQAQLAALSQQQGVYIELLEKAYNWALIYFPTGNSEAEYLHKKLLEFREAKIAAPGLPDVSNALKLLQKYRLNQQ